MPADRAAIGGKTKGGGPGVTQPLAAGNEHPAGGVVC